MKVKMHTLGCKVNQ
ncbi:MAG TPA: hypothetical protein DD650_03775, partial [Ruminococcaceae bacterium]|nr:hypothetical protein [Oscillospiraceae bacterium]